MSNISNGDCFFSPVNQLWTYQTNQSINENKSISISVGIPAPPFISFQLPHRSIVCGSLFRLIVELSTKYGYSIKRLTSFDVVEYAEWILYNQLDIIAYPMSHAIYQNLLHTEESDYFDDIVMSKCIGMFNDARILGNIEKGVWPIFLFLRAFDSSVWLSFLVSFIMVAVFLCFNFRNKNILTMIWLITCLFFGHLKLNLKINRKSFTVLTIWFLSLVVLISGFTGLLLNFLIKPIPEVVIDSWTDLYNRKDVRIRATAVSTITRFVDVYQDSDPVALDFSQRLDILYPESLNFTAMFSRKNIDKILSKVIDGEEVIVFGESQLQLFLLKYGDDLLKKLHISKSGSGSAPYFLVVNKANDEYLENDINQIISQTKESGIYDQWLTGSVYEKERRRVFDIMTDKSKYDWTELELKKLTGLFYLWCFGCVAGIAFLVEEYLAHTALIKLLNPRIVNVRRYIINQ